MTCSRRVRHGPLPRAQGASLEVLFGPSKSGGFWASFSTSQGLFDTSWRVEVLYIEGLFLESSRPEKKTQKRPGSGFSLQFGEVLTHTCRWLECGSRWIHGPFSGVSRNRQKRPVHAACIPDTPWDCHICRPIDPQNHPN